MYIDNYSFFCVMGGGLLFQLIFLLIPKYRVLKYVIGTIGILLGCVLGIYIITNYVYMTHPDEYFHYILGNIVFYDIHLIYFPIQFTVISIFNILLWRLFKNR